MPVTDNVVSLAHQRAVAALSAPLSKHVGAAAALEAARSFLQVQVTTADNQDRFDPVAVARAVITTRVNGHKTYGASWKDADITTLATLLAFTWVDATSKTAEDRYADDFDDVDSSSDPDDDGGAHEGSQE